MRHASQLLGVKKPDLHGVDRHPPLDQRLERQRRLPAPTASALPPPATHPPS